MNESDQGPQATEESTEERTVTRERVTETEERSNATRDDDDEATDEA